MEGSAAALAKAEDRASATAPESTLADRLHAAINERSRVHHAVSQIGQASQSAWPSARAMPVLSRLGVRARVDRSADCIYSLLVITWDESKQRENVRKHKIDLAALEPVFDYPMISVEDDRERYGELRLQSLGMWQGRVVFLVWGRREPP